MSNLGKLLKSYRQKHDIAQCDFSEELDIGKSTLCRIEKGKECDQPTTIKLINWIFR